MAKRVIATKLPDLDLPVNMQRLGQYVRARRTSVNITIEDAAAICGVSKQALCNVESGLKTVRADTVFKVLEYFGVKLWFDKNVTDYNGDSSDEWL
ncbi:MAG: helix-turn-helix domain-containing protein [Psychrosphaera sp.]|nr:helix-turn-helix domain-containing protein [Psychrosphaera sp.]